MINSVVKVKTAVGAIGLIPGAKIDPAQGLFIPIPGGSSGKNYSLKAFTEVKNVSAHIGFLEPKISYCVFAYGQTGSGKTFTILDDADSVIKRLSAQELESGPVLAEIFEIYNEKIYDLLGNLDESLKLNEQDKQFVIQGLSTSKCQNTDEFQKVLGLAIQNRSVAETKMNKQSSRSHLVIRISNERVPGRYINVIDLAGSEKVKKSEVTGTNLTEAININQSLTTLSRIFVKLEKKEAHIPYRDSTLTKILSNSMRSKIFLISCINLEHYDESIRTLDFANIARKIEIKNIEVHEPEPEIELEPDVDVEGPISRAKKLIMVLNELRDKLQH